MLSAVLPVWAAAAPGARAQEVTPPPLDILPAIGILAVITAIAFLIETLVEAIVGPLFDHVSALTKFKWALMYIAIAAGVVAAFVYQFDLPSILGDFLYPYTNAKIPITPFGIVLTGLAIGKGSNYLHGFVQRFFVKPTQPAVAVGS